ncbi:MAG: NAD(P)/FAD-dependent oxidoreductase, partial [Chromatiaceae bacterium]|nr:NAD(P)/FAD-dependent oxidoreductase [Chromatiaceae bacterium]
MQRVTIVGAGFGALTSLKTLRDEGFKGQITVVSPRPEFIYYPGLIWVPSGLRSGEDLRLDLGHFFSKMDAEHLAASATGVSDGGRL